MKLAISAIKTDAGTQTRVSINEDTVSDYADAMVAGAEFPPVVVFHDGSDYFMADGFHRTLGALRIGLEEIEAEVRKGTRTDALVYALGANRTNGLRRTNADKHRCLEIALKEFPDCSDRKIAEMCGVSDKTVTAIRPRCGNSAPEPSTRTGRDGKQYPAQNKSSKKVKMKFAERIVKIGDLAELGYCAEQIADELGICVQHVRTLAHKGSVSLPENAVGKTNKPNANRIVAETVISAQSLAAGLEFLDSRMDDLDASLVPEWINTLNSAVSSLNRLIRRLRSYKGKDHVKQDSGEIQQTACS